MRTFSGFFRAAGKILAMPSARAAHQLEMGHAAQWGDLGVHSVAPNSIIAWFQSPDASGGEQIAGHGRKSPPHRRRAQFAVDGAEPRKHAGDIAIQHREGRVIGNAQDGSRGVASDAGQGQRVSVASRKFAAVTRDDLLCGAM